MSQHRFAANVLHEGGAGAKNGAIRVSNFIPFDDSTPPKVYNAEFRKNATSPWIAGSQIGAAYTVFIQCPSATGGASEIINMEVRLNGGADGQWVLFTCGVQSWEQAPRSLTVTGSEVAMNAAIQIDPFIIGNPASVIGYVFKYNAFPLSSYPVNIGVDGGALQGADDSNPATNGAKRKTFEVFNTPISELEIHRADTGTNGTTLLGTFTNILTDDTLGGALPDFNVVETITNPSSNGATDGAISLSITDGVSPFSFLWGDNGATTQNRTGLAGGVYEVQITDDGNPTNIQTFFYNVVDPALPTDLYEDSILESSPINGIRFKNNEGVVDNVSVLNNADNTNYCENSPQGWNTPPMYEIFNVADVVTIQFRSDFETNILLIKDLAGATISSTPLVTKVDNINDFISQSGYIRSNGTGTIRVYPTGALLPEAQVGASFAIQSSLNYNGIYEIQSIDFDVAQNAEYMVINATYVSDANIGIDYLSNIRYNILEAVVDMAALGIGEWQLQLIGGDLGTGKNLVSEWIKVQAQTPNMVVFKYRNFDNAFKVDWSTGIEMFIRVFGFFTSSKPTRDAATFRNSNDVPQVLNAYVRRKRELALLEMPWYAVERIALIMSADFFSINGVEYFAEELPETETPQRYALSKMTATVEEKNWINEQNTHDGGDTSSQEISVIGGEGIDVLGI